MSASPNPRIRTIDIGTRELRKVKVYPVAYSQKIESNAFTALAGIFDGLTVGDIDVDKMSFSKTMVDIIKKHVPELVYLATEDDKIIDEIDDTQMVEMVEILYAQNFQPWEKKIREILVRLRDRETAESESNTQSASSSSNIPDIPLTTSITGPSKTAD